MVYDAIIVGGGPAGISAGLTLRRRNKSVAIVSGPLADIPLYKSHCVDNYPGMPDVSGKDMLETMAAQAVKAGVTMLHGRATSILPMGDSFGIGVRQEFYQSRAVILATGVTSGKPFPGEEEFLGRGVSYCVTCDGMLYRNKKVCVVGFTAETEEEAQLLRDMGCQVEVFTKHGRYAVEGVGKVERLVAGEEVYPCDGVFILRPAIKADTLLEGLKTDGAHILVDRSMHTNIPGVFAAGDCIGQPYQIPKAVGEGNIAALSADRFLQQEKGD